MNAPHHVSDPHAQMAARLGLGHRRSKWRWRLIWIGILLVILALIAWAIFGPKTPVQYETAAVVRGPLAITVTATGTLAPRDSVDVGAEVSGKIDKLNVDFNHRVKKGQVLAQINTEALAAQLAQAVATLEQNQATVEQTQATYQRYAALIQDNAISPQQRDQAKADYDRARANVALAKAQADYDRTLLEKATIVSPIDGVVLDRKVSAGQTVTAGFTTPVLFTLASDLTGMELDVDIDEADVGVVHAGNRATFTVGAYPSKVFDARLISVHNAAKTVQNVVTYQGVLLVDNKALLLKPGMTATATIMADKIDNVLQVPNTALRFVAPDSATKNLPAPPGDPSFGRVWTIDPKTNALKAHDLRIGPSNGRMTVVLSGDIKAGEKVVTEIKPNGAAQQ